MFMQKNLILIWTMDGDKTSEQYKNQIVMKEENGKKDALVRKIIKPAD